MKAPKLMIGDLVSNGNRNVRVINNTRTYITAEYETHNGRVVQCLFEEDIKLIPLTAEILKKNGFKEKEDYSFKYRNKEKEPFLCIYIIPDELLEIMTDLHTIILEPSQLYVHELQHALRLCGLNEPADNFKI